MQPFQLVYVAARPQVPIANDHRQAATTAPENPVHQQIEVGEARLAEVDVPAVDNSSDFPVRWNSKPPAVFVF
jgi:hypothetical protein